MGSPFTIKLSKDGQEVGPAMAGETMADVRGWLTITGMFGPEADKCEVYRGDRPVATYNKISAQKWALAKKENGHG